MRFAPTSPLLLVLLFVVAAFVACGDDSSKPATTSNPAGAATAVPTASSGSGTAKPGQTAAPAATTGITPNVQPTPRDDQIPPFQPGSAVVKKDPAANAAQALLQDVRTGKNAGYDRIVFEFAGTALPGYEVRYVQAARDCAPGSPVTTAGPAQIQITLRPAAAHDTNGKTTFAPKVVAAGFDSMKEAKVTCDFEGVVGWVVGTAEKPFRVIELLNPPRIAVDIQQ